MKSRVVFSALTLSAAIAAQAVPNSSELSVASVDNSPILSSPAEPTGNPFLTTTDFSRQNYPAKKHRTPLVGDKELVALTDIVPSVSRIHELRAEVSSTGKAQLQLVEFPDTFHGVPDPSTPDYNKLLAQLERWALQDPYTAMSWLAFTATDEQQQTFEQNIIHALLPDAASTVYEFRDHIENPNILATVERHMAMSMAEKNPALAFEWALELKNDPSRLWALSSVAHSWIREDHNAVIERFALLNDSQLKDQLINRISHPIASALVSADPYQALHWTDTLTRQQKHIALPAVFNYWLNENQEEARLWFQSLPESEAKEKMRNHDFWHALNNDIDYAANAFFELAARDAIYEDHISSTVLVLTRERPEEVEEFISALPDDSMVQIAKRTQRDYLIPRNPTEYLSLYNTLDSDDQTHHLAQVLIMLKHSESELVEDWLSTMPISDQDMKRAESLAQEYLMMMRGC